MYIYTHNCIHVSIECICSLYAAPARAGPAAGAPRAVDAHPAVQRVGRHQEPDARARRQGHGERAALPDGAPAVAAVRGRREALGVRRRRARRRQRVAAALEAPRGGGRVRAPQPQGGVREDALAELVGGVEGVVRPWGNTNRVVSKAQLYLSKTKIIIFVFLIRPRVYASEVRPGPAPKSSSWTSAQFASGAPSCGRHIK